jgi:predicted Zn-dependent protease
MRLAFLFFLLTTVVFGSSYFYVTTIAVCVTPLQYRIGSFDERFSLTKEEAIEALAQSEVVWEALTERDLFVYDESARFTVNFVFDERQAVALDQHETEARLNTVEEQNQKINEEFRSLERSFLDARRAYEKRVEVYNQTQGALNKRITRYNNISIFDADEERAISVAQQQLEQQATALEREVIALNQTLNELNALAERGNVMVEVFNQGVRQFNERFGESREFTQGDYQGDRINIYTFLDEDELVRVLVHEFGHALGIGHVENSESMMYHLMSNQPTVARLSAEDTQAFFATCGQDTDLKNRVITTLNKFIQSF